MFCPSCGAQNEESYNYCIRCGFKLVALKETLKGEAFPGVKVSRKAALGDILKMVIAKPSLAFKKLLPEKLLRESFLVVMASLILILLTAIIWQIVLQGNLARLSGFIGGRLPLEILENPALGSLLFIFLGIPLLLAIWIILTGLYQGMAKLLGGEGSYLDLLTLSGFAYVPYLIFWSAYLLLGLLSLLPFWGLIIMMASLVIFPLGKFAIFIWRVILLIAIIGEVHKLSRGKAMMALILSFAVVLAFILMVVLALLALTS